MSLEDLDRQLEFLIGAGRARAGFGFGSEATGSRKPSCSVWSRGRRRPPAGRLAIFGNAELRSVSGADRAGPPGPGDRGRSSPWSAPVAWTGSTQDALFDAFAAVADQGGVPIIVQDAPQNTGVQLARATLARLLTEVPAWRRSKIEPANPARKIELVAERMGGAPA